MKLETHGRWPLVGAVGLLPATAAALKRPSLRPLAALLWHQTEEWVRGLRKLSQDPRASTQAIRTGMAGGLLLSAALVPVQRWRLRGAQ